jgi:phosphomannomutase
MKMNAIKAAPAASAIALKNEKSAKAKRILIGTDVHLRGYQAARKIDNGVIGVGVDPTVVSPAANLQQEHSFLIPNDKA